MSSVDRGLVCWVLRSLNDKAWSFKRLGEVLGVSEITASKDYKKFQVELSNGNVKLPGTDLLLANFVYNDDRSAGLSPTRIVYDDLHRLDEQLQGTSLKTAEVVKIVRARAKLAETLNKMRPDPMKRMTIDEVVGMIYQALMEEDENVRNRVLSRIGARFGKAAKRLWQA